MKEKQKKSELRNLTFHNLDITNKKSDIASKINEMNISENRNIKLMSTFFLPSHINSKHIMMKNESDKINLKKLNILNYPLNQRDSKILNKLALKKINNIKQNTFEDIQNKILLSMYKFNLKRQKYKSSNLKNKNSSKLININKRVNFNISSNDNNNDNKRINSQKKIKPLKSRKDKKDGLIKLEKDFKYLIKSEDKKTKNENNITFAKNKINKTKNFRDSNNISPYNKYYITSNEFNSLQNDKKNKRKKLYNSKKNIFLYKTKYNKNMFQTKSFNSNNYLKLPHEGIRTNYNFKYNYIKTTNNSFDESQKDINKPKKIPKLSLNYWTLLEIENKLNSVYNNNCTNINEQKKIIKQVKEKCKRLLEEIDKKNNFEIQHIIKEINEQLLSFGFKDFFRYLLTILKNYDKKIVDWSFDIIDDKKECPEELKFKNVRNRHKQFMGILDRQYVCGVNVNNHMNFLIKNSKNKLGFNNQEYYDKRILNNNNNNGNNTQDHFIENIFTEYNYSSKFFETFLKNKNK